MNFQILFSKLVFVPPYIAILIIVRQYVPNRSRGSLTRGHCFSPHERKRDQYEIGLLSSSESNRNVIGNQIVML